MEEIISYSVDGVVLFEIEYRHGMTAKELSDLSKGVWTVAEAEQVIKNQTNNAIKNIKLPKM